MLLGEKRMDRRDIVKLTGIDRQTLRNIYQNKTKGIEFETLNKLCFALNCTPNDLLLYIPDIFIIRFSEFPRLSSAPRPGLYLGIWAQTRRPK